MWREAQRRARDRHWPAIERLLDSLPPRLFRQSKLLEYDMALRWSTTGQFRDVFLGVEQFPLTSIGPWLLEDLGTRADPDREAAESHLVVAAVLLAARAHVADAIFDPSSFAGREHVALLEALSERIMREFAGVVPAASPFWDARAAIAEEDLDAVLADAERRRAPATPDDPMIWLRPAWAAPARLLALAAMASDSARSAAASVPSAASTVPSAASTVPSAASTTAAPTAPSGAPTAPSGAPTAAAAEPRDTDGADVAAMLDALAVAAQIREDLATMQRDLQGGRPSFPIAVTAQNAHLSLHPWPSPTVVLGAMVVTRSLERILDEAIGRSRASRDAAMRARLPTFAAYLDDVTADLEERRADQAVGAARPATVPAGGYQTTGEGATVGARGESARGRRPLVPATEPTLPRAIAMAEGFLLADRTFRESWEMHREGMFGAAAVWSRFPEGLILEILAAHGHVVTPEVDDLLSFTVANGFRYFTHPGSGVDSDTLGVFLRLLPSATPNDAHRVALERVLTRLDAQVRATGEIPVWITADEATADRPATLDLGDHCGTVAAHLLLGLLSTGDPAHEATVARGTAHLLGRIADVGLGANVDYPPLYALARFEQLIACVSGPRTEVGERLAGAMAAAHPALEAALERAIARGPRSAQDAALMTLACLAAGCEDRLDPTWQGTILKGQRFDGGWNGEPFAAAPNRGRSVTWYSSATLTSALCYDALRRAQPGAEAVTRSARRVPEAARRSPSVV